MARIPMVRCPECGQEFSALRADCPHCGARRTIGDTRSAAPRPPRPQPRAVQEVRRAARSNWQLVIGVALILLAVLAVMLMLLSSRNGKVSLAARETPTVTVEPEKFEPKPTPTPSPTPTVMNIKLFFLTHEITPEAGGFTMYVGDAPLTLTARAYPNDKLSDAPFTWRVSDPSKASLTVSEDTQSCEVMPLESAGGYITLTVSCYGVEYSVPYYIWAREAPADAPAAAEPTTTEAPAAAG